MSGTIKLQAPDIQPDALGFFRFGDLDGWKVLTNDAGEWHALRPDDFNALISGKLTEDHGEYAVLQRKGFIRADLDLSLIHISEPTRPY